MKKIFSFIQKFFNFFLLNIILFACSPDNYTLYNTSKSDLREKIFISEIHWAGSIDNDGKNFNPDDDFIELKSDANGSLDISGWSLIIQGGHSTIITIPSNTILNYNEFYTIGNNTNNAFTFFNYVNKNFRLPNTGFRVILKDGNSKIIDKLDFYNYDCPPAGADYPLLKKSMLRIISYFGAEEGNNPSSWTTYKLAISSSNVNNLYINTLFCSPGVEFNNEK